MLDKETLLLAGSDWSSTTDTLNPWLGIETLVTRKDPNEQYLGSLWEEQVINLKQALKIFTLDGAAALTLEDLTGSIEVGKSADFIILNHNIFTIDRNMISEAKVNLTMFNGKMVYTNTE